MTMTVNSPPPSPDFVKPDADEDGRIEVAKAVWSMTRENHSPTSSHAVNRHLYYNFPTPPLSPTTSTTIPQTMSSPRPAPSLPSHRHTRTPSRTVPYHERRRSSLSTSSLHSSQIPEETYGPPPHPAPTVPLPPIPGAPRIPYTTPQEVRARYAPHRTRPNRYSSYEILRIIQDQEQQQREINEFNKRHSAPIVMSWVRSTATLKRDVNDLKSRRAGPKHKVSGEDFTRGILEYEDTEEEEL